MNLVPAEYVMERDGRSRKYFENMMRSAYNHDRVQVVDGKMLVDENYDVGEFHEMYDLYLQAEALAKNTHALAADLDKYLSDKNETPKKGDCEKRKNALYLYFRYGAFKHFERAREVKAALVRYINDNSLFGVVQS